MQDSVLLIGILVMLSVIAWFLENILVNIRQIHKKIADCLEEDYKTVEKNAEIALAEEEEELSEEASLYKTNEGTYSYEAYAMNKKKRDALKNKEVFIDDFEEAAEALEKGNRYGR